jgi:predicted nuclease with TOPRIM domain
MNLINLVSKILKEQSEEDYAFITQDEVLEFLKLMSGNLNGLSRIPKFRGKKLVVNGPLDLSLYPKIQNLGPIVKVTGRLDISGTEIASLEGIETTGYVSDYNSKRWRIKKAKEEAQIKALAQSRREDGDWDDLSDGYNAKAHALFEYLKNRDGVELRPKDLQERIDELENRKSELEIRQEQLDSVGDEYDEIERQINQIESQIDELNDKDYGDVYDLIPDGEMYGLAAFKSMITDSEGEEYFIANSNEVDVAFKDYWRQYIDDVGLEAFNRHVIEDCIDMDELRSDIEDVYENDVRDNPEAYLSDEDKELSGAQEEEINNLETEKSQLEEKLEGMNPEDEEYDETTDRISEIEVEIDEIKDSPDGDYSEDAIDEKVEETVDYYVDNYDEFLSNMGYDIKKYVDKDELTNYLMRNEDYGQMSSYNSDYDTIEFNGEDYYIFRHN